jgi:hypothetical protein
MRRALLHVIPMMALVGVFAAPSPALAEPELEGTYLARGVNPDGSAYRLVVQIAKLGESFLVTTMIPDAPGEMLQMKLVAIGIGILNGEVLSVGDYSPDAARVMSYRIEDGGRRLAGRWTYIDGDGTVYEETLTKLTRTLDTVGRWTPRK